MNKKIKLSLIMLLSIGSISIASIPLVSCGNSKDPTPSPKNFELVAIKTPTSVSVAIANAGVGEASNQGKWDLFILLWSVTTNNIAEEDMTNVNIVRNTSPGETTFFVSSKNVDNLIMTGDLVSNTITPIPTKTSALSLKSGPIVSIAIANSGVAEGALDSAKWSLFNLIWNTTTESLEKDDMANVKIDSSESSGATIFTVSSKNVDNLTMIGNLVSNTITPTQKIAILSKKVSPSISNTISNSGIAGGANNSEKWTLVNLIWSSLLSNNNLVEADMTNITISRQGMGSPDAYKFTVSSTNVNNLTLTGELESNTIITTS